MTFRNRAISVRSPRLFWSAALAHCLPAALAIANWEIMTSTLVLGQEGHPAPSGSMKRCLLALQSWRFGGLSEVMMSTGDLSGQPALPLGFATIRHTNLPGPTRPSSR